MHACVHALNHFRLIVVPTKNLLLQQLRVCVCVHHGGSNTQADRAQTARAARQRPHEDITATKGVRSGGADTHRPARMHSPLVIRRQAALQGW